MCCFGLDDWYQARKENKVGFNAVSLQKTRRGVNKPPPELTYGVETFVRRNYSAVWTH